MGDVQICVDNNAREAKIIEEGESSNLLTGAKCKVLNFSCPQRRNEFWQKVYRKNAWHIQRCPVLPHIAFWPFFGLPSPLTFHNVKNHGGKENSQGTKNKRKQRKQHKTNRKKTTKNDTGGTNNIVRVFWWKRRRPKAGDVFTKTRLMPV